MSRKTGRPQNGRTTKPPIQPSGIVFALGMNVMLVTGAQLLVTFTALPLTAEALATFVGPVIAGVLTAVYVRERGGIHAFLGGVISVPILTYLVFGGYWQFGIFAGAFCGLAGSLMELVLRRR
ncbi:MAG: hypothetical protein KDE20_07170 [Caldilineaceae bacterium]|nr:hypothetical protein [Caldilineaceae bacterium]MCB0159622.1 hypothetical protein [Caldilineaceae bacterium]